MDTTRRTPALRALGMSVWLMASACSSQNAQDAQENADPGAAIVRAEPPARSSDTTTHVLMRRVDFHLPRDVVLRIAWVEGEMRPLRPGQPIVFDDIESFAMRVDAGEVALSMTALERLMNDWVFAGDDAPLRELSFETTGDRIRMRGKLDAFIDVPFEVEATPEMTPGGEILMRPERIRTAGAIGSAVRKLLGLQLDEVVDLSQARGIRAQGDQLFLDPSILLPPPRIEGPIVAIRVEPGYIVQRFGADSANRAARNSIEEGLHEGSNEMWFRGGQLGFGKLRMIDADLRVIDLDPRDSFDFSIVAYEEQLVAGFSRNTEVLGLDAFMPDLNDLRTSCSSSNARDACARPSPPDDGQPGRGRRVTRAYR
jgi:hypothetical protein